MPPPRSCSCWYFENSQTIAVFGSYNPSHLHKVKEHQVEGKKYIHICNVRGWILWAVVLRCYGNVVSSAQCKQIDHRIKWMRMWVFMHARATLRDSCVCIQMWQCRKPKADRFKLHWHSLLLAKHCERLENKSFQSAVRCDRGPQINPCQGSYFPTANTRSACTSDPYTINSNSPPALIEKRLQTLLALFE